MNGSIIFDDVKYLAEFLKEFTGSTAVFRVESYDGTAYKLTFTGGY